MVTDILFIAICLVLAAIVIYAYWRNVRKADAAFEASLQEALAKFRKDLGVDDN